MKYGKLFALFSAGTLIGCSPLSMVMAPPDPGGRPLMLSRKSEKQRPEVGRGSAGRVTDVQDVYRRARQAQDAGHAAQADALYAQVLLALPGHGEALNARGVLRARSGHLHEATSLFRQALAASPRAAHIRSNLGYAYLLAGEFDAAESELLQAQALDPGNDKIHSNLEQLTQLRALAMAAGSGKEKSDAAASTGAVHVGRIVAVAPHIYELREPAGGETATGQAPATSSVVTAMAPAPAITVIPAQPRTQAVRLQNLGKVLVGVQMEVSNGVGIRHMARRTAQSLAKLGLVTTRLTNQPGFRQARTEIQYGAGHQLAAQALSGLLPTTPMTRSAVLPRNVQIRLVLGHDQVGRSMAALNERPDRAETMLSQYTPAGWMLAGKQQTPT